MMEIYTVSFFGHRQLDDFMGAARRLEKLIRELLAEREYVEFLVGRNGDFAQLAASTVLRPIRSTKANTAWPYFEIMSQRRGVDCCMRM